MLLEVLLVLGAIALSAALMYLKQGAPYVPSTDEDAAKIVSLAKKFNSKKVIDLGSGNGNLVIPLAQHGFDATGIELNPMLVSNSKRSIKNAGLKGKAKIKQGSFWKVNLANYDTVVLYGIKHIMPRLERKLIKELAQGSVILSNFYVFPNLIPVEEHERIKVYKITSKSKSLLKSI